MIDTVIDCCRWRGNMGGDKVSGSKVTDDAGGVSTVAVIVVTQIGC